MELSFETQYRAMSARDARFDGQFIAGVLTTGIYCRPSCPALTPRPGNVRFFRTAAAAHEAGLRACKRASPMPCPAPEWKLRDDLAARAMRLIRTASSNATASTGWPSARLHPATRASASCGTNSGPARSRWRGPIAQTARSLLASTEAPRERHRAFAAGFA
ncbi:MAG: Ada metal-binding domain-containing protein [Schumannella sp.]